MLINDMNVATNFSKGNAAFRNGDAALAVDFYHLAMLGGSVVQVYRDNLSRAYKFLGKPELADLVDDVVYTNSPVCKLNQEIEPARKRITVAIPTFNRHDMIQRLVTKLDCESESFDVTVLVFDDGSHQPVLLELENIKNLVAVYTFRQSNNHGKKNYWRLVNKIFDAMSLLSASINIYLADDMEVADNFFASAIDVWENIVDSRKVTLNLLNDGRISCWTGYERHVIDFSGRKVYKAQWVDMAMLFDQKLLRYRLKEVPLARWKKNPLASSGVGDQLSRRLHKSNYGMYQVISSLGFHGEHESKMNFEERMKNPLISDAASMASEKSPPVIVEELSSCHFNFSKNIEKKKFPIICGVATVKGRVNALQQTVASIISQVDRLVVYQNNYKEVFDFLQDPKIEVISSLDTGVDMGDAGKFYTIEKHSDAVYFSIDDDLIYPADYVSRMYEHLKLRSFSTVVTCHGRVMRKDATSYYKHAQKVFRCLDEVDANGQVEFGGTGVMAFHTGLLNLSFEYFASPNMADIWVAIRSREKGVIIEVLSHSKGWILHSDKFDMSETIYEKHRFRGYLQNILMREYFQIEEPVIDGVRN